MKEEPYRFENGTLYVEPAKPLPLIPDDRNHAAIVQALKIIDHAAVKEK